MQIEAELSRTSPLSGASFDLSAGDRLLVAQSRVLEMIAGSSSLEDILSELCLIVESQANGPVKATILLVDERRNRLNTAAAPSLPKSYSDAAKGLEIKVGVGTCVHAAAIGEVVVTRDIRNDPAWAALTHISSSLNLLAAWSTPIRSSTGKILGTFGTYFHEERGPEARERRLIEVLARTAALALERRAADAALMENARHHQFLADLTTQAQTVDEPGPHAQLCARMLALHLGAARCVYAEVDEKGSLRVMGDSMHEPASPAALAWRISDLGRDAMQHLQNGVPVVVDDRAPLAGAAPETNAAPYAAWICAPLHQNGRLAAVMTVLEQAPREWISRDTELVGLVGSRCWEALERLRVAQSLRASEARFRAIVEATPECVKVVSSDGMLLQMNAAGVRMLEAPSEAALLGHCVCDVVVPEHRAAYRAFNERVCAGEGGSLSFDIVSFAGNRRCMDTTAVPWRMSSGGVAALSVARDVTAQRNDRQRLAAHLQREQKQAQLLRGLTASALNIHAASTVDAVLQTTVSEAQGLLGAEWAAGSVSSLAHGQAEGKSVQKSCGGVFVSAETLRERATRVAQARKPLREIVQRSDSQTPGVSWLAVPLVGRDGLSLGVIHAAKNSESGFDEADEAILVQLAQAAASALDNARLYDRLREQDRSKDEFLATLAHELRNPLAPICTGLELLCRDADEVRNARARDMMGRQLRHMVRMVDDLLDVSRITLGKVALKPERVEFKQVLESALETLRPVLEPSRHSLSVQLPSVALPLQVDPTRISQVFANLLHNAIKYTPEGGSIRLTAEAQDGLLVVRLRDSGSGIPKEMLPRVFDMFTQVGGTLDRAQGGLGIGLTLVRRLVEMHGGTVAAESEGLGHGCCFTVRLPLSQGQAPLTGAEVDRRGAPSRAFHILVVDDNVDGAEALQMLLEIDGHQVWVAHDGPSGIALARQFQPEVIFSDIGLPGMDGYQVARAIRAERGLPQPLLVAITGWGSEEDRRLSREAGFDQHLVKPVDSARVAEVLVSYLGLIRFRRQTHSG